MSKKLGKSEDWAKVVGMPDKWDLKNIQALVDTFNATIFTLPISDEPNAPTIKVSGKEWAAHMVEDTRKRHGLDQLGSSDFGIKSSNMDMRILCSIPQPLHLKLQEGYPTMFKDVKHHMWFAKNFKQFLVPRKL